MTAPNISNNKLYKYELVLSKKEILEEILSTKAEKGFSYLYKFTIIIIFDNINFRVILNEKNSKQKFIKICSEICAGRLELEFELYPEKWTIN